MLHLSKKGHKFDQIQLITVLKEKYICIKTNETVNLLCAGNDDPPFPLLSSPTETSTVVLFARNM